MLFSNQCFYRSYIRSMDYHSQTSNEDVNTIPGGYIHDVIHKSVMDIISYFFKPTKVIKFKDINKDTIYSSLNSNIDVENNFESKCYSFYGLSIDIEDGLSIVEATRILSTIEFIRGIYKNFINCKAPIYEHDSSCDVTDNKFMKLVWEFATLKNLSQWTFKTNTETTSNNTTNNTTITLSHHSNKINIIIHNSEISDHIYVDYNNNTMFFLSLCYNKVTVNLFNEILFEINKSKIFLNAKGVGNIMKYYYTSCRQLLWSKAASNKNGHNNIGIMQRNNHMYLIVQMSYDQPYKSHDTLINPQSYSNQAGRHFISIQANKDKNKIKRKQETGNNKNNAKRSCCNICNVTNLLYSLYAVNTRSNYSEIFQINSYIYNNSNKAHNIKRKLTLSINDNTLEYGVGRSLWGHLSFGKSTPLKTIEIIIQEFVKVINNDRLYHTRAVHKLLSVGKKQIHKTKYIAAKKIIMLPHKIKEEALSKLRKNNSITTRLIKLLTSMNKIKKAHDARIIKEELKRMREHNRTAKHREEAANKIQKVHDARIIKEALKRMREHNRTAKHREEAANKIQKVHDARTIEALERMREHNHREEAANKIQKVHDARTIEALERMREHNHREEAANKIQKAYKLYKAKKKAAREKKEILVMLVGCVFLYIVLLYIIIDSFPLWLYANKCSSGFISGFCFFNSNRYINW